VIEKLIKVLLTVILVPVFFYVALILMQTFTDPLQKGMLLTIPLAIGIVIWLKA